VANDSSLGAAASLLGRWWVDPSAVRQGADNISLCFFDDGRLTYMIHLPDRHQIMHLTYRIEGDTIITNQSSAPREERTRFAVENDERLHLFYGDIVATYIRSEE
jgi:hypothetical protein